MAVKLNQLFPPLQLNLSVGVNAPAGVLWREVRDNHRHVLWNRRVAHFEWLGGGVQGQITWKTLPGFKVRYRVEAAEAGGGADCLLLQQVGGPWWMKDSELRYVVEEAGRYSRVRLKGVFVTRLIPLRRIHGAFLAGYHGGSLMRLKDLAEGVAARAAPRTG